MTMFQNKLSPTVCSLTGLLTFLLACNGAIAQPAGVAAATRTSSPTFAFKGFEIIGQNPLSESEVSRILAPYVRSDATIETLQQAAAALEAALKEKGFALHQVVLPPQEVGGSIKLNLVKFVIGKVSIDGRQRYSERNIRASLPELVEGQPPNFHTLAVQTAIANESQGKQVQVALKESEEADKIDARIAVQETKPWNFSISLANTGTDATGNDRLTLAAGYGNLFDKDQQLTAAYTTSIAHAGDVKQVGLNYRIPLYLLGGVAGISYTYSNVVGNFGSFTSTGAGQTLGLNYNHYLAPTGGYRSYFSIGLDDKRFDAALINGLAQGQSARRSRPLTVGYNGRIASDTAVWGANVELALNLPGGEGNDLAAYQSEDPRINTARWKALRGAANYATSLAAGWLWSTRGQFQYSADSMISGEQFGLGGASSVRGTRVRPISGDSGLLVSTEISTPELAPGLRLLGFVDVGRLANHNPNANRPASDGLSSLGLGSHYVRAGFTVSLEYARVLSGSSVPFVPGSGLPQTGDHKLHLNASAQF